VATTHDGSGTAVVVEVVLDEVVFVVVVFEVVDLDVVDVEVVVELSTGHQALVPNIVKVGFVPSVIEVPATLSA
jgi:hypothetical protein